MRKLVLPLLLIVAGISASVALAGSPHFINSAFASSSSGNTLHVEGKEAGLGDESQIHVTLTADALCINHGGNHPKAVNKTSVTASDTFPVQNGKAEFSFDVTATFQPECSPPMTVAFRNIVVTDDTNGLTHRFPNTG